MTDDLEKLAVWVEGFRTGEIPEEVMRQAQLLLLDTLGCALAALPEGTVQGVLEVVADLGGRGQARILGTARRAGLPNAVFANGVLIRALDLNDYLGETHISGHPSDNLAVILALADWQRSSGREALRATVMAYELYGRLQELVDRHGPWDHVTATGLVAPAAAGFLMNLDRERLTHALALGAVLCPTLGAIRAGHLSAAKGMANASVAQAAVFHTLLAAKGLTGPLQAMEGPRGLSATVLSNKGISEITAPLADRFRIMDVHIKPYPSLGTSQSLVAAALAVRQEIGPRWEEIKDIYVTMADLPMARAQAADQARRYPTSREAADHSFYFLPAVALIDGELTTWQFEDRRWEDRRVNALMDRITIDTDADLTRRAPGAFPVRLRVVLASGEEHSAEVPYHPGHARNRLGVEGIIGKFTRYNGLKHHRIDWQALAREVEALEKAANLDGLLGIVCRDEVGKKNKGA